MPCNLAVSITKAAVTEERLLVLLTPAAIQPVIEAYLAQPGVLRAGDTARVTRQGERLTVAVAGLTITIEGGRVRANATAGRTDVRARALVDGLSNLLSLAADALFAQQVKGALSRFGKVGQQQVVVEEAGVTQAATVLTLKL